MNKNPDIINIQHIVGSTNKTTIYSVTILLLKTLKVGGDLRYFPRLRLCIRYTQSTLWLNCGLRL